MVVVVLVVVVVVLGWCCAAVRHPAMSLLLSLFLEGCWFGVS